MTIPHRAGAPRRFPGAETVEHRFVLPLAPGDDRTVEVFAREVRAAATAGDDKPFLLMLNGGPGMMAHRPDGGSRWLRRALADYHVLLLDQRGTGLSTPVSPAAPPDTEYLSHFRADAIVRDAEQIRRTLLGDGARWSLLGQSFGGFVALTYLSFAPEAVREAFITGGLPPLDRPADDVYRATAKRFETRLRRYLDRYPEDRAIWERVTAEHPRYKGLGNPLGMSDGLETRHYLAERAAAAPDGFHEAARAELSLTAGPLYAVLHESIYAQGGATRWAAQRVLDERGDDLVLHGEWFLPSGFVDELAPLAAVAGELAEKDDWPPLYDPVQLARNEVPVTAAVYLEDIYVESAYSLETAEAVRGTRVWATNEFDHDGLHAGDVLDRLIRMRRGEA